MAKKATKKAEAVIDVLNRARGDELASIFQYMSVHYELADADLGQLAADIKLIAIDEMRHAEMLAERILILGGVPVSKPAFETKKRLAIADALELLVQLEEKAIADYNEFLEVCREQRDYASTKIIETLLPEEQIHLEHFENLLSHVKTLGAVYLAKMAGGPADTGGPARGFAAAKIAAG